MKIIDSFLFFKELDLLEVRLRTLWDHVDKFIFLECDHTFVNTPKPFYFDEVKERFNWARDKIVHCKHKGKFHSMGGDLDIENQQREMLYHMCVDMGYADDDVLLIGDSDEILSREAVQGLRKGFDAPTIFDMDMYYYNVHCPRGITWQGTVATRFGNKFKSIGDMRVNRHMMANRRKGGWHFSYFYDIEGIQEKLKSFAHTGYSHGKYVDPTHIKDCIAANRNLLEKKDGVEVFDPLPEYVMCEMRKFPRFVGVYD